jgi:lysophospholipase L1-like esterase
LNGRHLLLLGALLGASSLQAQEPLRIMPLGDSITRGLTNGGPIPGGYRERLYTRLTLELYPVDFVGSANDNPWTTAPVDADHEGHGGWRIDEFAPNIAAYLEAQPAVLLLHLGTNDINQDTDLANAPTRLNSLLNQIALYSPRTEIVVAQIIGSTSPTENTQIQAYNAALTAVVSAQQAAGHNVTLMNAYSAVSMANMADTYHPTKDGYDQLADAWFGAVQALGPLQNPVRYGTNIVATRQTNSFQTAFAAATNDLIQAGAPTLSNATHTGFTPFNGSNTGALNDGRTGAATVTADTAFDPDGTWTSDFYLQTGGTTNGYDISEIRILAAWPANRASLRVQLQLRQAGSAEWDVYGTFALTNLTDGASLLTLTNAAGPIASGVDALRFNFLDPGVGNYDESAVREIDVFGTVTIPQPSTLLLVAGGLGLLFLPRRRAQGLRIKKCQKSPEIVIPSLRGISGIPPDRGLRFLAGSE